jgi:hypothetical protein
MRLLHGPQGKALESELGEWRSAGRAPRLFLRDDDAISDTPALRRLFQMCETFRSPLLLAAIPAPADESLGRAVRAFELATGAVHGFRHANHSPKGEKPCELDRNRGPDLVLGELREGRAKLAALFGGRLSQLLVPPWNRIHDEVATHVHEAGFAGISAHGWLTRAPTHRLATVNAHIDIVHWSGGRTGRDPEWVSGELAKALREARIRDFRAVGILSHHLAHDEAAWSVLGDVFDFANATGLSFIAADELIAEPAEMPEPLHAQA